ncbi:MAG: InlB B-repeat-containing protein, partial [Kiritimatiellae bacterium]|nr:InlB B-repeat-containing protein [Kiritimatiellia bacterium]
MVDEEVRYVTRNSEIGNPPKPSREGYLFDGWFTSPSGGTMISPSVVVKGPTTYYAHWTALHTVLFNANGGSVWPTEKTVANGTAIGKLPVPEKIGYRFDGWYSSINNEKLVDTTIVDGNLTLIARWAFPMVEVSCDSESKGSVVGAKTAKIGTKVTLKAIANKGYVFSHWEGPLDDATDPRSPSVAYVVGEEDVQFMAHFIPASDDMAAISFEMVDEYVTGEAIAPVGIDVFGCTSLPTVKVTGLPAGLKFTTKDVLKKGSKTEVEYPANTIYGTPTKSGVYTVVATVTTAGKKTAICSQTIIVRKSGEKVVVAECDVAGGKVTGGGVYAEGKKVALKATANKGFVFAGWYEDEAFTTTCDSTVVDYRTASYAYTMGDEDKTFYARFIPAVEDSLLDLTVNGKTVPTTFTISEYAQLKFDVDSLSLPKISVKGLPAGMKFTAKPIYKKGSKTEIEVPANTIYGAPTKPELKTVTVSISNQSIKKAIVKEFSIEVPNLTGANSYFVDNLDNGVGAKCVLSVG